MSVTRRDALLGVTAAAGMTATLTQAAGWAQAATAKGYGKDPNLTEPKAFWPSTLDPAQRQAIELVVSIVLPATDAMPSGIEVKVPAFVDQWISAPYPDQRAARERTLQALAALEMAARNVGQPSFATAADPDAIFAAAWQAPVSAPLLRELVKLLTGGYASSTAGMTAIGYVGNTPRERFDGPPPEVVAKLDAFVRGHRG